MKKKKNDGWMDFRKKLFKMVSVGVIDDRVNQAYDIISTGALILNLVGAFMSTFQNLQAKYGGLFNQVEAITVAFFAIDFLLRLITAKCLYPKLGEGKAVAKYMTSFAGVVDLLTFLPYYLPVVFPSGAVAFKMFRVVRIMRLFRINAYYDSLNVITEVISSKKQQILSSVFILVVLMLAASLCMYSLEHEAQPEVFENAFSGIWWAAASLMTVGYGDIVPVTTMGKIFGMVITFLGVGMAAIPTGIISAGFVEQYTRLKRIGEFGVQEDIHFIMLHLDHEDEWTGKSIKNLGLPKGAIIVAIERGKDTLIPKGDVVLKADDKLIVGAQKLDQESPIDLKEVQISKDHPWAGAAIRNLDISRRTHLVLVKRKGKNMIPKGDLVLKAGDTVLVYHKGYKDDIVFSSMEE